MVRNRITSAAAVALALVTGGCSLNRLVADNVGGTLADAQTAFNAEGSVREAREAAPALLKFLDAFIVSSPENRDLLLRGAEMNATFAFGLIETEDPAWARVLYEKARGYGRRALRLEDKEIDSALDGREDALRARLVRLEPGDAAIPGLFWAAFAWGGYINVSRTDQRALADLPKVVAIMERLAEVAPAYFHAGPHLFLAVYYGSRGKTLGGDIKKSALHFQAVRGGRRSGEASHSFLLADVLYARFLCVALGEEDPGRARQAFTKTLEGVLAIPDDPASPTRLLDAIARERARKLLPELDDLILPPAEDTLQEEKAGAARKP